MKFAYRRSDTETSATEVDIVPLAERAGVYRVTVGERAFELDERIFHRAAFLKEAGVVTLQFEGREYRLCDTSQRRTATPARTGDLHAPMTGKIIRVLVQPGETVQAGATLLILEAMKMEQQITAPHDGVVARVQCREGDQVTAGTELVVLTPLTATAMESNPPGPEP